MNNTTRLEAQQEVQKIIDTTTTAGITYIGQSVIGTGKSEHKWLIYMVDETGADIEIKYAESNRAYDKVWDNRAGYTYSIS